MKKILFVDNEQAVLDGLRRILRGRRHEWEMTFVNNGLAALEALSQSTYSVIVSDMRMPRMDGAALLAQVQEDHPGVVRIALTGHSEFECVLRGVPVAHQFLNKPCDAKLLQSTISRACSLQNLLRLGSLRSVIRSLDSLPGLPKVYHALMLGMQHPGVAISDIVPIVQRDPALADRILQLANSAAFEILPSTSDLEEATSFLGLSMLRDLTLSMEAFHAFEGYSFADGFSFEAQQAHAMLSAQIARELPNDKSAGADAFMASMLQDLGKLVIAAMLPEQHARVAASEVQSGLPDHVVEEQILGTSHAEIGGYILGLWGLPYPIVEAVANHHRPARVKHTSFDALGAVHVADALAREVMSLTGINDEGLDLDYLQALGVLDELPRWRELAHEKACLLQLAG